MNQKVEVNKCCINIYLQEKNDIQTKIDGIATVYESGDLYREIKQFEEKNNLPPELKVKSIIVINIEKVNISVE